MVKVLDCTLRDGGYINDWRFGEKNIKNIIHCLEEAQIDIIECGFLQDKDFSSDISVFSSVSQLKNTLSPKAPSVLYVAMIALGDISIDKIFPYDGSSIDGIRLTFHKEDWEEAKKTAAELMQKGYKVFIQPVGTTSYSDSELLSLVEDVNRLHPYAFYLVDTLGILYQRELRRLFYLIDHNLERDICLGLHSHNNLQLSFSNAQEFIRLNPKRETIVDASIFGMGRGVGNLATELITEYINDNIAYKYSILPLLTAADKYIMPIYTEQRWGYDLPYFLSAAVGCHPNYASYLLKKGTLDIENISQILALIPANKRDLFHKDIIETLYLDYQQCLIDDSKQINRLSKTLNDKKVLIIAPGQYDDEYNSAIKDYIQLNNPIVISVNHISKRIQPNIIFFSNRKRFEVAIDQNITTDIIITSNINANTENCITVNYSSYIGEGKAADNAGAMLIKLLKKCGVTDVALIGFNGFTSNAISNFSIEMFRRPMSREEANQKNEEISLQLTKVLLDMNFEFLTPTRYTIQ